MGNIKFINADDISKDFKEFIQHYLYNIINEISNSYGEKDNDFILKNIEFKNQHPQIFLSGNEITIIVGSYTKDNKYWCLWQLAHEGIHLLSPETQVNNLQPLVIEEGLATLFSRNYINNNFSWSFEDKNDPTTQIYIRASGLVNELLNQDNAIIKKVRQIQPSLSRITHDDLIKANSLLDNELCRKLCESF